MDGPASYCALMAKGISLYENGNYITARDYLIRGDEEHNFCSSDPSQ